MKVFVSLPMGNKTIEEIKAEQLDIFLRFVYDKDSDNYELIETALQEPDGIDVDPNVYCLGRSIMLMGEADLVIFARDWRDARGCRVEHAVCELYKIPHCYVTITNEKDEANEL